MSDTFLIILIKPSRYDDDGYVVQWRRSVLPSNALSVLNALAEDCAARQVLGPEVEIRVEAYEDQSCLPRAEVLAHRIKRSSAGGMVGIVGAHSSQFPRGADLARRFRVAGLPVVMGGFHVSGSLSMLPETPPELQEMLDLGISLFIGEAEGRFEQVLRDAHTGSLKPMYDYRNDLVDLTAAVVPSHLPENVMRRMALSLNPIEPIEAGRGCPFKCTFCTVINVHGREARTRTPETIAEQVRNGVARGRTSFFFTDDNLVRNRRWREILTALIKLREEEGLEFTLMVQVDAQCDRDPDFIPMAVRAGCIQVFVGMESINPDALAAVGKKHNDVRRYQRLFLNWKRHGVVIMVGYIFGFPNDTVESMRRDVQTIKRQLAVDLMYFYVLTPLPGSADHVTLSQQGVKLDPDLSHFTSYRSVSPHPLMSREELDGFYDEAWRTFYDDEHCGLILRRHASLGGKVEWLLPFLTVARGSHPIEHNHPFEYGLLRVKSHRERRPDLPKEAWLPFIARRAWDTLATQVRWFRLWRKMTPLAEAARGAHPALDDPALAGFEAPGESVKVDESTGIDLQVPTSGKNADSGLFRSIS